MKRITLLAIVAAMGTFAVAGTSVPLTSVDKKCQSKCPKKLEKIGHCVEKAYDQESMLKCRIKLIRFANKIQRDFHVKVPPTPKKK